MKMKSLIALGSLFLIGLQMQGRVFLVTTTQDGTDVNTLRGAINAANAIGGNNSILIVCHGTFQFYVPSPLVITSGNLTIKAPGTAIIDTSGLPVVSPVFRITFNASATFENLKLTGGIGYYTGGGIQNDGQLTLNNCNISGNIASGAAGGGGGINNSGNLTMFNCTVDGNSGSYGGGICNYGNLMASNCIISGNSTLRGIDGSYFEGGLFSVDFYPGFSGLDGGRGGGIYNSGNLSLNNSIIANNVCGSGGNGTDSINDDAGSGGNGGNGGGIYNDGGSLILNRCTVKNNSCGNGGSGGNETLDFSGILKDGNAGNGGSGGGIFNAGDARLRATFVWSNSAGSAGVPGINANLGVNGSGPDLFGTFTIGQ